MLNVHLFKRESLPTVDRLDQYERTLTRGHKERAEPENKSTAVEAVNQNDDDQEKQIIYKVKRFLETGYKLK